VAGSILHFYAVAAYGLQHPDTMNYTAEALAGLRARLSDVLHGRASLEESLRRTRKAADGKTRITRREGDPPVTWRRGEWPVTIASVCTAETFGTYGTYEEYAERVERWARSVIESP
jgi:hypothetical protein